MDTYSYPSRKIDPYETAEFLGAQKSSCASAAHKSPFLKHLQTHSLAEASTPLPSCSSASETKVSSVSPFVSIPRTHTAEAATTKHAAPSENTPPCPNTGNTTPTTYGPISDPTRPIADANPDPVARAPVPYNSGV